MSRSSCSQGQYSKPGTGRIWSLADSKQVTVEVDDAIAASYTEICRMLGRFDKRDVLGDVTMTARILVGHARHRRAKPFEALARRLSD
jgi:hypothetical protein